MTTQRRPGISGISVVALLASFGLCPAVTVLAIPLGLLGLRDVRRTGRLGRTASWIAIVVGCVMTPLTTWGLIWWNNSVRIPMIEGPYASIAAGQRGDIEAFRRCFDVPCDVADITVARFMSSLHARWGLLQSITQDTTRDAVYSDDGWSVRIPYRFRFEEGTVPGEAEFILSRRTATTSELVHRFGWVVIGTGPGESPLGWPPDALDIDRAPLPDQVDESTDDDTSSVKDETAP